MRNIFFSFFLALFLVSLITTPSLAATATQAGASNQCAMCWSLVGNPVYTHLGTFSAFKVTYRNDFLPPANVTGIVFVVVHNTIGQTVEYSTATLPLAMGANGTAYLAVFGLQPGSYTGIFFVLDTSGVGISQAVSISFAIPNG